ncbi:tetratricopeptide repeat protein, partial [bacterium]|nr:tetratricopeptide repeat protein [bacterium]
SLITAGIAALYAPWMYYDGMILSASWILFLNAVLLYLLLVRTNLVDDEPRDENRQLLVWGLAGLVCGFSALARPSILIFAVLLIIAVMIMKRLPRRVLKLTVFVLVICAVHLPVLIRNRSVDGSIAFATSSGGINFYIGNRDGASGKYDDAPWLVSSDVFRESEGYRREAEARSGEKMTLNQSSTFWAETALREIFQNKSGWLKLMGKKLWLLVRSEELANNFSFNGTESIVPWLRNVPLRWGLLLPFAAAGLVLLWPQRKKYWIAALYALGYIATNLIFFVSSEYRFPLILLLLPLAAYFLVAIWKQLEARAWGKIGLAVAVYLLFLLLANWPSPSMQKTASSAVDYNNLGSIAALYDNQLDALQFYTRALMIDDSHPETRIGLADALWSLGSYDEARAEYKRAGIEPPDALSGSPADSLIAELDSLVANHDIRDALALLESRVPKDAPTPLDILEYKAKLQFWQGQYADAYLTVMEAHEKEPKSPVWLYLAADYLLETGDAFHSDSLYREAIRRYPAFAPARIGRAFLAVETGDIEVARYELSELQKISIPEDTVKAQVDSLEKLLNYIGGNN